MMQCLPKRLNVHSCKIPDKGATTAWCPIKNGSSAIALGTKDGASGQTFDDYGGELGIYSVSTDTSIGVKCISKTETTQRFNCLAWGSKGPKHNGIIAGGMQNGVINVWDPDNLGEPVAKVEKHRSKVNALDFNPHQGTQHLLATGASDNEVYIVDLNNPSKPTVYSPAGPGCQKHAAEVRSVSWNTEVVHILATAALDGACTVWSLKAKKPWAEIRDPNGAGFSAISWSPAQGLHLLTASNDDRDPVIRLWDVRSSTTQPLAEYRGHSAGIFSLSWCYADPTFIVSCGKDNKTLFWDLYSGKPVHEVACQEQTPKRRSDSHDRHGFHDAASAFGNAGNVFEGSSGIGGGSSGRRYLVQFSPHDATVFSSCSFDRNVQFFSINGGCGGVTAARKAQQGGYRMRAPKWYPRGAGASFGFGNKLVHFGACETLGAGTVRLSQVVERSEMVNKIVEFENTLANAVNADMEYMQQTGNVGERPNMIDLCSSMGASCSSSEEKETWEYMKLLFQAGGREVILKHLGFDVNAMSQELGIPQEPNSPVAESTMSQMNEPVSPPHQPANDGMSGMGAQQLFDTNNDFSATSTFDSFNDERVDDDDVFGGSAPTSPAHAPVATPTIKSPRADSVADVTRSLSNVVLEDVEVRDPKAEDLITKALLVGNFDAAVSICLKHKRFADAVLLASCGGQDLWNDTVSKYLQTFYMKKSYVPIIGAIVKQELEDYVSRAEIGHGQWKRVLAIISQYAEPEKVPTLCESLAERLLQDTSSSRKETLLSACLCFVCARNAGRCVDIFSQLGVMIADLHEKDRVEILQSIVQRIGVYKHALQESSSIMTEAPVMQMFIDFALVLASQNLSEYAAKYVSEVDTNIVSPNVGYDENGNQTEYLDPQDAAHNVQAARALELKSQLYISCAETNQGILNYIPGPVSAFVVQEIGVSPSPTTVQPEREAGYGYGAPSPKNAYGSMTPRGSNMQGNNSFQQQNPYGAAQQANPYGAPQQNNSGFPPQPQQPSRQPQQQQPQQGGWNSYNQGPQSAPVPSNNNPYGGQGFGAPSSVPPTPTNNMPYRNPTPPMGTQNKNKPYVKQNDGFGSTVGNKEAASMYGNLPYNGAPGTSAPYSAASQSVGGPNNNYYNPQQQQQQQQPMGGMQPNNNHMMMGQQPQHGMMMQGGPQQGGMRGYQSEGFQQPMNPAAAPAPAPPVKKEMPPAMIPLMQQLDRFLDNLGQRSQSPVEKRKLADVHKAFGILKDNLMSGTMDAGVQSEVTTMLNAIMMNDINTANAVRQSLGSKPQIWATEKEWLKGVTSLILLAKSSNPH